MTIAELVVNKVVTQTIAVRLHLKCVQQGRLGHSSALRSYSWHRIVTYGDLLRDFLVNYLPLKTRESPPESGLFISA